MIFALCCTCAGSESLVRSIFEEAKLDNWLDIPVYKGDRALEESESFIGLETRNDGAKILYEYISNRSSYAVIVGWDRETGLIKWSDIAQGDPVSSGEAVAVVKMFA